MYKFQDNNLGHPFFYQRRNSRVIFLGTQKTNLVAIGGNHPLCIQSMTTTLPRDIAASVKEIEALHQVGCTLIRLTVPTLKDAQKLGEIREIIKKKQIFTPLVADIHFTPQVALEAAKHVEKVRINPGNFAERRTSSTDYDGDLTRIGDTLGPLVTYLKETGKALRIGTNHGSLSERIVQKYGDTPEGMVESALEFVRICQTFDFQDIILSMKASNPQVMIDANRLLVKKMDAENMAYPIHLGVTEAGNGEEGRVRSAIGIGALLTDGIGDTIRVSLTEDPVLEIPFATMLTARYNLRDNETYPDPVDKHTNFLISKPLLHSIANLTLNTPLPTVVQVEIDWPLNTLPPATRQDQFEKLIQSFDTDTPCEIINFPVSSLGDLDVIGLLDFEGRTRPLLSIEPNFLPGQSLFEQYPFNKATLSLFNWHLGTTPMNTLSAHLDLCDKWIALSHACGFTIELKIDFTKMHHFTDWLNPTGQHDSRPASIFFLLSKTLERFKKLENHRVQIQLVLYDSPHESRQLLVYMQKRHISLPIHLKFQQTGPTEIIAHASATLGSLLTDQVGHSISIQANLPVEQQLDLGYQILQSSGRRITKAEFISCPSCGRTLFDLQSTTNQIKQLTGHLKNVKIAIMGCIVNGPGEMADADFGYVGAAAGKISLFVGRTCVEKNIPQAEACQKLIELIKAHHKWADP